MAQFKHVYSLDYFTVSQAMNNPGLKLYPHKEIGVGTANFSSYSTYLQIPVGNFVSGIRLGEREENWWDYEKPRVKTEAWLHAKNARFFTGISGYLSLRNKFSSQLSYLNASLDTVSVTPLKGKEDYNYGINATVNVTGNQFVTTSFRSSKER
ncbi:hypothetical protein QA601_07720 [Chitinispirillales bacterium ANBcel5]|uniref:hypothetical protein n=1 Tax=Cellulosispirillum alkaliphilum TaxID=3039283 RepID=UPI002A51419A|nr:hypothetical protein [Chitinispirillales bacterium ANBcel5]